MGRLNDLNEQLKKASVDVQSNEVLILLKEKQSYLIDLETARLFRGLNSLGVPITPPYKSEAYAEFKRSLNPNSVVDLKVTGDFWRGFFLDASNFPVLFDSSDSKSPMLQEKYEHIFGEDDEDMVKVRAEILGELRNWYLTAIYTI